MVIHNGNLITITILIIWSIALLSNSVHTLAKTQPNITGTYESKLFEITNMSAIYNPDGFSPTYEIVGIAHNVGNSFYDAIQLSVELYDDNNTLIGVEKGYPNAEGANPGDNLPFKISTSESVKNSDFDHFHITVAGKLNENSIDSSNTNTANNSSSNFVIPQKEDYDRCVDFAGKSFCDAFIYEECVKRTKNATTTVLNQTSCDNLLKTLNTK